MCSILLTPVGLIDEEHGDDKFSPSVEQVFQRSSLWFHPTTQFDQRSTQLKFVEDPDLADVEIEYNLFTGALTEVIVLKVNSRNYAFKAAMEARERMVMKPLGQIVQDEMWDQLDPSHADGSKPLDWRSFENRARSDALRLVRDDEIDHAVGRIKPDDE